MLPTEKFERFDHDASTKEEILNYIRNRRLQVLHEGWHLAKSYFLENTNIHCATWYNTKNFTEANSYYLPPTERNQGLYSKLFGNCRILTTHDCGLENYLIDHKIDYCMAGNQQKWDEYGQIQSVYADKRAKRSNCYLMDHIDGGLAILDHVEAGQIAKRAFCLHPLLQSDEAMHDWYCAGGSEYYSAKVILLAMDYRAVANDYLSTRKITSLDDIKLSCLDEVNKMLIADKIQNYKDFLIHHKGVHERSDDLDQYFKNWITKLDCWEEFYIFKELLNF